MPLNGASCPLVAFTGSGKSYNKKQTCHPPRKYRVHGESVVDQKSISGKIVSLILCMWKPGFVKSGHILCCSLYSEGTEKQPILADAVIPD